MKSYTKAAMFFVSVWLLTAMPFETSVYAGNLQPQETVSIRDEAEAVEAPSSEGLHSEGEMQTSSESDEEVLAVIPVSDTSMAPVDNQTETGEPVEPEVVISYKKEKLEQGKDYFLTYENNREVGTATVTVTGTGVYTGTAKLNFDIVPASPALDGVKSSDKGVISTWKACDDVDGYILYRNDEKAVTIIGGDRDYYLDPYAVDNGNEYTYKIAAYKWADDRIYTGSPSASEKVFFLLSPADCTLSNNTEGVEVSWEANKYADGYEIYRDNERIRTIEDGTGNAFVDKDANEAGKRYTYRVASYKETAGEHCLSELSPEQTICYLDSPKEVTLQNTTRGVTVRWSASDLATGYDVYRDSVKIRRVTGGNSTTLTDTGAAGNGKTYQYKIAAVMQDGEEEFVSAPTAVSTAYYLSIPEVSSFKNGAKGIKLTWKKNKKADGFEIYRDSQKITTIAGGNTNSFIDTEAVSNGRRYSYKVTAFKNTKSGQCLSPTSVGKTYYYLARPSIESMTNSAEGVKIKWTENDSADGYEIYRDSEKIKTVTDPDAISFTDTGAKKNGNEYTYQVVAYKLAGGKQISSALSSKKAGYYLASPKIKSVRNAAKGVKLTWSENASAGGYIIYRGKEKIKTIRSSSEVSYTDQEANKNGKKYTYKVAAFRKSGKSVSQSPASQAQTTYFVSRAAIKKLTSEKKGVRIEWKKNKKASGYVIYRNDEIIKTVGADKTAYTDTKANHDGQAYTYKVVAYLKNGSETSKGAASEEEVITYRKPPDPTPTPAPVIERSAASNDVTVYITDTGKKYHKGSCASLKYSSYPISRSRARELGYEPCGRCHPG